MASDGNRRHSLQIPKRRGTEAELFGSTETPRKHHRNKVDFAALDSKASKSVRITVHAVPVFASLSVVCSRMCAAGSAQQEARSRKCALEFRGQ